MAARLSLRYSWALLAALALAARGRLAADLAQASPFLPSAAAGAAGAAAAEGPIELRGIMATPNASSYCIYDTAKKRSVWVGLNESGHDFVVKSADTAADAVTVDYGGRTLRLVLHTSKVASAPPSALGSQALASTVLANPSPGEEQRRLDAVAQEVRRRRLERERAVQALQGGQTAPGSGVPPLPNR